MRGKVLISAALAAVAMVAFAPAPASAHGDIVAVKDAYSAGTIVVKTNERRLYLMLGDGRALRYPVGVGRAGMQWAGTSMIGGKYLSPAWSPPPDIKRAEPRLPDVIPGGSPHNPMGVAAMTLAGTDYAIHGTNRPAWSAASSRMAASACSMPDITDLFGRVGIGTRVVVVQ